MYDIPPLQYLSETFTCSSKVTLSNISKGLVKVTFPLPHLYNTLMALIPNLKDYFCEVKPVVFSIAIDISVSFFQENNIVYDPTGCFFFPFRFFYRSLVFHSDPAGPLGHLLCRGLPKVQFSFLVAVGFEPMSWWS